jgi:hypothetical protein
MEKKFVAVASIVLCTAATPCLSADRDPTQSRWYRWSGWAGPVQSAIETGRYVPVPPQYQPQKEAFFTGWAAGKTIERQLHLGDRLYQRLEGGKSGQRR